MHAYLSIFTSKQMILLIFIVQSVLAQSKPLTNSGFFVYFERRSKALSLAFDLYNRPHQRIMDENSEVSVLNCALEELLTEHTFS